NAATCNRCWSNSRWVRDPRRTIKPSGSRNPPPMSKRTPSPPTPSLRDGLLNDFATLKVPVRAEHFDSVLARAEREGLSQLEFLQLLLAEAAQQRRDRSLAHRLREARFRDGKTLATFDWEFNAKTIDRTQIEASWPRRSSSGAG